MELAMSADGNRVRRRSVIVLLSAMQAIATAALALRTPRLFWSTLALPLVLCLLAFLIDNERRTRSLSGLTTITVQIRGDEADWR